MAEATVLVETGTDRTATVILNRPKAHNAFDEAMVVELTERFEALRSDDGVRCVVLTGRGKSFCAGADIGWMRRAADFTEAQNRADAQALSRLMSTLNDLPKPTIALVHGAAYGGGVGLAACCDIVVATPAARFQLSEVKLGLVPAVISPYVIAAIGARQARRYFISAETIDAAEAHRLGLVHVPCDDEAGLAAAREQLIQALGRGGPEAIADAKSLIAAVAARPIDAAVRDETARRIAARRQSQEAREGTNAFLEKRHPNWVE